MFPSHMIGCLIEETIAKAGRAYKCPPTTLTGGYKPSTILECIVYLDRGPQESSPLGSSSAAVILPMELARFAPLMGP